MLELHFSRFSLKAVFYSQFGFHYKKVKMVEIEKIVLQFPIHNERAYGNIILNFRLWMLHSTEKKQILITNNPKSN